jgi:hypothetical protein
MDYRGPDSKLRVEEPSFRVGGLSVWVDGYQFAHAADYWDGNWVNVRVECIDHQANVKLSEPCLHLPELAAWAKECQRLLDGEVETARLEPMEPNLDITIEHSGQVDRLVASVKVTPAPETPFYEFQFSIDSPELTRLVASLARVLAVLPIRGSPPT